MGNDFQEFCLESMMLIMEKEKNGILYIKPKLYLTAFPAPKTLLST